MSGRYSFGPRDDGGTTIKSRGIFRGDEKVGYMKYTDLADGELNVAMVEAYGFRGTMKDGEGGANMLGPVALGHLMGQLREEGYKSVSGSRFSGARHDSLTSGAYLKVDLINRTHTVQQPRELVLRRATAERQAGQAHMQGTQPRAPAGESNGGQWVKE